MKCVGIDIGSFSIKIVELNGTSKSASLKSYTEIPLSQDINKDKSIEIIDALRSFTLSFDATETHFIVGLSEDKVMHRRINFPFKERYNILKSLPFELEELIPLSQENAIFDAKILYNEGNTSEAFTSATSIENVENTIKLCNDCNFDPRTISSNGLAFSNIFETWNGVTEEKSALEVPGKRAAHIILDIGHNNTTLLAYAQNELLAVRNFKWGGKNIADNVARKYHIQYSEALAELKEKAYILIDPEGATEAQLQFSNTIKESVTDFGNKLKLVTLDIASQFDIEFEQMSICGGTTKIKNLNAALTQEVEISCNMLSANPHAIANQDPQFNLIEGATALGLAIEGLKLPRNPSTNFLQGEFAKNNKAFEKTLNKWGYAAKMATAFLVIFMIYAVIKEGYSVDMVDQAKVRLKDQAKTIAQIKARRGLEKKIKTYIKGQEKLIKNYKLMKEVNNVNSALDFLAKLSSTSPSSKQASLDLKAFVVFDEKLFVEGLAANPKSSVLLKNALKAISKDSKVKNMPPSAKGRSAFAYEINIDRLKETR